MKVVAGVDGIYKTMLSSREEESGKVMSLVRWLEGKEIPRLGKDAW